MINENDEVPTFGECKYKFLLLFMLHFFQIYVIM